MSFEEPAVEDFRGLSMAELDTDQAYLNVSGDSSELFIYLLNKDCIGCPLQKYELNTVSLWLAVNILVKHVVEFKTIISTVESFWKHN